eukprot:6427783-Prymnesium_polylepis.1
MEPVGVHARRRSQPGEPMEWPHSNRRENDPPSFGAYRQGSGTSSMADARGAFNCRRKGLGVVRIAAL